MFSIISDPSTHSFAFFAFLFSVISARTTVHAFLDSAERIAARDHCAMMEIRISVKTVEFASEYFAFRAFERRTETVFRFDGPERECATGAWVRTNARACCFRISSQTMSEARILILAEC